MVSTNKLCQNQFMFPKMANNKKTLKRLQIKYVVSFVSVDDGINDTNKKTTKKQNDIVAIELIA